MKVVLLSPNSVDAVIIGVKFVKAANKLARKRWKKARFIYAQGPDEIVKCLKEKKASSTLLPLEDDEKGDLPLIWKVLIFHDLFITREILAEVETP